MKQQTMTDLKESELVFVIHKHDATSLHFDFRLQIGMVMPSWAIPKGPTMDPTMKRLAMETTDHSMYYRHFEGVLPEGAYGAGPVMIWDEGIYYPEIELAKGVRERIEDKKVGTQVMREGMKKGELKFFLDGQKVKGSFALVKTKSLPAGRQGFGGPKAWLMIKHKDAYIQKGFDAKEEKYDTSVVSGKTLEEIVKG
jgi:bifunctional non-homologous end joining protein LigD